MRLLISFDDTDNLESPGTGHLLEDFRSLIRERGWGASQRISRHQLFVHKDVPYTSHNSSMCFVLETKAGTPAAGAEFLELLEREASVFLRTRSAAGSDPGLSILDCASLADRARLIEFGRSAKTTVLNKELAYETARLCGVRLSEHGGTGDGVIGALAGCALRLEGEDGRLRGQLENLPERDIVSSAELLRHPDVDALGRLRPEQDRSEVVYTDDIFDIRLKDKAKTVMMCGRSVFLLYPADPSEPNAPYEAWTRQELKRF